jgi:hypothetical protein
MTSLILNTLIVCIGCESLARCWKNVVELVARTFVGLSRRQCVTGGDQPLTFLAALSNRRLTQQQ